MSETIDNKGNTGSEEIDVIEVLQKFWRSRKIIYKTVTVFFIIGLIIVLGTPKEYVSEITVLTESNSGSSTDMSGLFQQFGGFAGVSLRKNTQISSNLYPIIIKSKPFLLDVINKKVTESKYGSQLTVAEYIKRYNKPSVISLILENTIGLPGKIIGWIKGKPEPSKVNAESKNVNTIYPEQIGIANALSARIEVKKGKILGTLVLSVEMQDPLVAAQLTDSVLTCLTGYITNYNLKKVKADLEFVVKRQAEAETKYLITKRALASFRDRNKNVISANIRSEEERLQTENSLAMNVYNGLSNQLEQAKLKVQERTPVFRVMEPAKVPSGKSKPKIVSSLVLMIFLGTLLGIGLIFMKMIYISYSFQKK
jgi:uncharacterized protein involved in exopolysaccharide biosynthesis